MDEATISDFEIESMRTEPKRVTNPKARRLEKRGHLEQNFEVVSIADPQKRYRIFWRQSLKREAVFSVGLVRLYPSGENLVLARYNGAYHTHMNVVERTRLGATPHRHVATERYITAGCDADGYAETRTDYRTSPGALHCLVRDCNITGLETEPDQDSLF